MQIFLVPEKYKTYNPHAKRFGFNVEGLKILRDHPSVPIELKLDLVGFLSAVE